nr:uncharacterized protein LOC109149214 [Ipomoea batatas]
MDFEVFDGVKFQKAKAITRFNRFRMMMKTLQFLKNARCPIFATNKLVASRNKTQPPFVSFEAFTLLPQPETKRSR